MATNTKKQFKVNTLSKDFDIKLKDIAGVMKGTSYDVSAQAFLDGEAFDVFFNRITKESQIVGIDDYINGAPLPATDKPVQNNASEQKNEQSVKQENDAKPEKKPGIFEIFKSKLTQTSTPRNEPSLSITGEIFLGTHKCPCCGNESFVKCGCGAMTCMPANSERFKCAVCGGSGTIDHYISDLSGDMNEGGGSRKKNTLG